MNYERTRDVLGKVQIHNITIEDRSIATQEQSSIEILGQYFRLPGSPSPHAHNYRKCRVRVVQALTLSIWEFAEIPMPYLHETQIQSEDQVSTESYPTPADPHWSLDIRQSG